MATHSSVLAWRIPGTVEPGGLPSMGLHRVRHDWSDLAAAAATSFQILTNSCICPHSCFLFLLLCEKNPPSPLQLRSSSHPLCLCPTASVSSRLLSSSLFSHPPPCYKMNIPHAYTPFQSLLSYFPSVHAKILKTSEFIFTVSLCSVLWNWAAILPPLTHLPPLSFSPKIPHHVPLSC